MARHAFYVAPVSEDRDPMFWRARCQCGWSGPIRFVNAVAARDGAVHVGRRSRLRAL